MDDVVETAIHAATEAGRLALRYFGTDLSVELKPDESPVTRADRECEARIIDILRSKYPDFGILAEESGRQEGTATVRWIIDPIDGTKNFIRNIPFFATLIALEENGEVTVGVIHAPALGETLYAQKGRGAFAGDERVHVSTISELSESMLVHGGLSDLKDTAYWPSFLELIDETTRQRGFGDALGHTVVVQGMAEVALEPEIKPWDVAATKIIVEEAGGRFSDFQGVPSIYTGDAVISNGLIHDRVLEVLGRGTRQRR